MLYTHDHLVNAIGSQKVSYLCLLDLSAAFDTIDHNILITRLSSWFGIHGSVLSWFKSYHLAPFVLNVITTSIPFILFFCGVLQGSVLGPLLFVMYTTPLSTRIPSLSPHYYLYADDTQLFSHPLNFESSISNLKNALQHIFSWMTAILLILNSSKTEFLLFGLKNQLAKIHNSSLDTSHSARNLGFIFDKHLTFSDQITSLSEACYYHNCKLRCIRFYVDSSTAYTIATSIVHSKLDYCNSLCCKLPKCQLSSLQQIQNSLASTVVKAPKSCHITPILRSLHWLRITELIEYKFLSFVRSFVIAGRGPAYSGPQR